MSVDPVSLAITVALTAANMALTASQEFSGPRVDAAPATVADYGAPLNYFLGTRLLSCPCFFAKPIEERKNTRKGKGGKQTTYTGYGTWAVQIADHEIGDVLQIWFDNHLVYDATGSTTKIYPLGDDYELSASLRFYMGGDGQEPDPDMQAYIEARDGAGTCPAYRETSYIYFENVPLEKLGNRFPDVKVMATQQVGLTIAAESDIDFVGQQGTETFGTAGSPISFALTDGLAATPAAGDFVMIVVNSARFPLATDEFHSAIAGYTPLTDTFEGESLLSDMKWRAYYKFMGSVPDTTFTPSAVTYTDSRQAYQVMVFRGVGASVFASEVTSISGVGPTSYEPADIVISGATFDPGDIGGTVGETHYVFKSFALASDTGRALPIVIGGQSTGGGGDETVGNMLAIYQVDTGSSSGTRSARAYALFGNEVIIGQGSTLGALLTLIAQRGGLDPDEYDFSQATQQFDGYNWSQASGKQICEAVADLFDVDIRPHNFLIEAVPRGSGSTASLPTAEFVADDKGGAPFALEDKPDLPRRVFLTYADTNSEQNPNVAMPAAQGADASDTVNEPTIDMTTLAITPDVAQPLSERWLRRQRFGRWSSTFSFTRQRIGIEPSDIWTPSYDGEEMIMRCTKVKISANGKIESEWTRDQPALATLSASAGAVASGFTPTGVPDAVATLGFVLDVPLLVDANDQTAPLAYISAGPAEPGTWTGADYAWSDTGDADGYASGWDGVASGYGAVIGTCAAALPDALPWVPDMGSSLTVAINAGELTAATLEELLADSTLNLAAIRSGDGWELVQFMTPTLTDTLTYTITGFLRGVRGTEWAIGGHAPDDEFVLMDTAKIHTMGASEIGDTDYYIAATTGQAPDEANAFAVAYTGASHKPLAPVLGDATLSGADWLFDAVRRTRIGGGSLDNQDVPLGQASESWSLDILDGATVVRTITGTSLPLTYTEADQITDFGIAQTSITALLYQIDPTLNLRGYPLALAA